MIAWRIGRGIGEAARFDDDPVERRDRALVAARSKIAQGVDEIAAQRTAKTTGRQQDHIALDPLDQQMIEADLAPFVDDDERVGELGLAQQPVQQRRLASAEKAGDDADRESRAARVTVPSETACRRRPARPRARRWASRRAVRSSPRKSRPRRPRDRTG